MHARQWPFPTRPPFLPITIAIGDPDPGKPCKLSCAEAFAAALYICGWDEAAITVMKRFKWCVASRKVYTRIAHSVTQPPFGAVMEAGCTVWSTCSLSMSIEWAQLQGARVLLHERGAAGCLCGLHIKCRDHCGAERIFGPGITSRYMAPTRMAVPVSAFPPTHPFESLLGLGMWILYRVNVYVPAVSIGPGPHGSVSFCLAISSSLSSSVYQIISQCLPDCFPDCIRQSHGTECRLCVWVHVACWGAVHALAGMHIAYARFVFTPVYSVWADRLFGPFKQRRLEC